MKFLSIYHSNLDEFFMIRVSGLHEQIEASVSALATARRVLIVGVEQMAFFASYLRHLLGQAQSAERDAAQDRAVEHAGQREVRRVDRAARHLARRVDARKRLAGDPGPGAHDATAPPAIRLAAASTASTIFW
jgi:polyphosphate kinase